MNRNPNVALDVNRQFDSACFLICIRGEEYLTGGVAWGSRDSLTLFAFIVGYFQERTGSSFPPDLLPPSSLPWLGTVGSPVFTRLPRRLQARLLAASRRLATAIICQALLEELSLLTEVQSNPGLWKCPALFLPMAPCG